jgi:hypothetical protein
MCSIIEKDIAIKKRIKRKEEFVAKLLAEEIDLKNNVVEMWRDMVIDSSCTRARPDFAYHCGTHIVIVEVDEEQHRSYNNCGFEKDEKMKAENIRMYNIGNIFQGLPVVFIRYNPDDYKNSNNKKVLVAEVKYRLDSIKAKMIAHANMHLVKYGESIETRIHCLQLVEEQFNTMVASLYYEGIYV